MIKAKELLEKKLNPADREAIQTLVDSDATHEELTKAATWHALHARIRRIENAVIALQRHQQYPVGRRNLT